DLASLLLPHKDCHKPDQHGKDSHRESDFNQADTALADISCGFQNHWYISTISRHTKAVPVAASMGTPNGSSRSGFSAAAHIPFCRSMTTCLSWFRISAPAA